MGTFSRLITDQETATQVASLLNTHNKLGRHYLPGMIKHRAWDYIVETIGNTVIGCVKVEKQSYNLTEIKHLVVDPRYRKTGIAKALILAALNKTTTPLLYAMIRHDNIASQKVFEYCGFRNSGKYTTADRDVLLFTATGNKWCNST